MTEEIACPLPEEHEYSVSVQNMGLHLELAHGIVLSTSDYLVAVKHWRTRTHFSYQKGLLDKLEESIEGHS